MLKYVILIILITSFLRADIQIEVYDKENNLLKKYNYTSQELKNGVITGYTISEKIITSFNNNNIIYLYVR